MTKTELEILIENKPPEIKGETLPNAAAVLDYLQENGWKITKTSLYRHQGQGKLLSSPDGSYTKAIVKKYAMTFLKQTATGKRVSQATDALQQKKLNQDIELQAIKIEREIFHSAKEQGLYIPKDQMDIEVASAMGVLLSGTKHWLQSEAAEWIAVVGGNNKKVGEFINLITNSYDELTNSLSHSRQYEVIFETNDEIKTSQQLATETQDANN